MKEQMIKEYLSQVESDNYADIFDTSTITDIHIKGNEILYNMKYGIYRDDESIELIDFLEWLYIRGNK